MEMKEFGNDAWHGFAGCRNWQDGKEPLIGSGTFEDGKEYVVVFDPTGCCLVVENHLVNLAGGWILNLPFSTQEAARAFGTGIPEPRGIDDFLRLGFEEA